MLYIPDRSALREVAGYEWHVSLVDGEASDFTQCHVAWTKEDGFTAAGVASSAGAAWILLKGNTHDTPALSIGTVGRRKIFILKPEDHGDITT